MKYDQQLYVNEELGWEREREREINNFMGSWGGGGGGGESHSAVFVHLRKA